MYLQGSRVIKAGVKWYVKYYDDADVHTEQHVNGDSRTFYL